MSTFQRLLPQAAKTSLKRFFYKYSLMASQAGQDHWIYGEAFDEKRGGYFIDIGAHDGVHLSNTYILESRYRWSGICIEANPVTFESLKRNRRALTLNVCLDRAEGEVRFALRDVTGGIIDRDVDNRDLDIPDNQVVTLKTTSLGRLLDAHQVPRVIDYLSIDVEGAEERILAGFDLRKYTFRCITIERPTALLRDLFHSHGYLLIKEIPQLDCFYVHQDYLDQYKQNVFRFHSKKYLTIRWR